MGRKTAVCEQYGQWKPWLHLHQAAPVSVSLVVQYHLVLSSPMCWPPANIAFFPVTGRTVDPSDPVVGDSDWLLCSKPRPLPLVQRRGATAALNGKTQCARVCARARFFFKCFFILTICPKLKFSIITLFLPHVRFLSCTYWRTNAVLKINTWLSFKFL